jgi:hypothetical protein
MQARGEYGQGLRLDEVSERPDGFTFVCPTIQQFIMQLQKDDKVLFNGELVKTPGITAVFRDYRFFTKDARTAELIRKSRAFERGLVKELGAAKEDAAAKRKAQLKALLDADPELKKELLSADGPLTVGDSEAKAPVAKKK